MSATTSSETIDKVHFVGSIALDSVDEVYRELGAACGRRLRRVPDGEPGGRRLWLGWQWPLLRANAYLQPTPRVYQGVPLFEPVPGIDPGDIAFGELGYAREARSSYQDFVAARQRGELPEGVRFQVALPPPFAVICSMVVPEGIEAVLPAYEKAMFAEVGRICDAIPHEDLSIQWDICIEMLIWDGESPQAPQFPGYEQVIRDTVGRCCASLPQDVELGIHLCYGDMDAEHFVAPLDLGKAVELANVIVDVSPHPLAWLHLPVPADRDDDAYFAPLSELELPSECELYIGLIHEDGKEANDRRIAAAAKVVSGFGIATECGIARKRTATQVRELIHAHADNSVEPGNGASAG